MSFSEVVAPLFGRLAIVWYLVTDTWSYATDWHNTMLLMTDKHIPIPPLLFALALLLVAMCALALVLGYQTRHAAMALFAFVLLIAVLIHNFWQIRDADLRMAAEGLFARDVLMMGALLLIVGLGAGRFAVDNAGKGKKKG